MHKVYLAFFGTLTVLIGLILSIGFLSIFPQFSPEQSKENPTADDPSLINGDETNSAVRNASEEDYPIPYYGLDDPIPYSEHTLSSGLMCGTAAGEPYFTGVGTYCNGRNAENYSTYRLSVGSSPGIGGRPGSIDMRGWPLPNPYADGGSPVIIQDFKTHGSYGIDLSLSGQPFDFVPVYATITGETIDGSDSLDRNKPNADFHPYGSFMRMRNAKWIVVNAQRSWLNRRLTAGSSAGTFTTDPDAPDVRPFGRAEYDGKTIYGCNKSCEIGREVCESCATDDDPDCMECDWVDVDVIEADCDSEIMDQALAAAPDKQVIPGQGLGSIASNCTMYKPYEACVMQHGEFVTYEPLGEDFLGGTFITKVENYETVTAHLTYSSIRNSPEPLLAVEEGGIASYPIKHLEGWQMGNMGTSGNPASTNINDLINSPSESYTRLPMIHYEVWKNAMGNPFQNDHRCHEYIQLQPVDPASFFDQPAELPPSTLFPACDQTWDVDGAPVGTSASTINCRYLWNQDNTTWQQAGVADCRPEPGPQFDWMYHRGGRSAYDYTGIQAGARVAQKLAEKVANIMEPAIVQIQLLPMPAPTEGTFRIMSLNIHHGNQLNYGLMFRKMAILAEYIKTNQIQIAALQEVETIRQPQDDYPAEETQVAYMLQRALEAIDYPMQVYVQSNLYNADNKSLGFRNVTFSVFPMQYVTELPIKGGAARRAIVNQISTNIGEVYVVNAHVHHDQSRNDSYNIFRRTLESGGYLSDPSTVITGDFNRGDVYKHFYSDCTEQPCNKKGIDLVGLGITTPRYYSTVTRVMDRTLQDTFGGKYTFDHPAIIADISQSPDNPDYIPDLITPPAFSANEINGTPVIRMMNYNPGSAASGNDRSPQFQNLATYASEQNVELLLIQEPTRDEMDIINAALLPTFPYMTQIGSRVGGELNPIFSRYPFVPDNQQEWRISQTHDGDNKRRVVLSVKVQTPYGELRAVNLHTHGDTQCEDAYYALEPITNPSSPYFNPPEQNFIIAGDFNIKLESISPFEPDRANSGAILYRVVCDGRGAQYINIDELAALIRSNYKANCLDPNTCENKTAGGDENIEMVWSMNNNPIEIYKMWDGPADLYRSFGDPNNHPIVLADIGDPSWSFPPIPPILKPGLEFGVVSFNLDQACTNSGRGDTCPGGAMSLAEGIKQSFEEGKRWDIIGFQEVLEPSSEHPNRKSDTEDLINIMKEQGKNYSCIKQRLYGDDFISAICAGEPFDIIESTYLEHQIYQSPNVPQLRVVACVQVNSPAGVLVVCNTHPRAGSDPPAQFKDAENWIFNTVLPAYIPASIPPALRNDYLASLRARLIMTGDMNTDLRPIIGKMVSACKGPAPEGTGCGIDQVMHVDMSYGEFGHSAPFNVQYLESLGGYRDTTRPWPTDHLGPTIVSFVTRELKIE